jgi:hypothetical protein
MKSFCRGETPRGESSRRGAKRAEGKRERYFLCIAIGQNCAVPQGFLPRALCANNLISSVKLNLPSWEYLWITLISPDHYRPNGWVKTHRLYEAAAALATLTGVIVLVAVYFPILNPGFYEISLHHQSLPSTIRYFLGTPVALLILVAGWYFNRKAGQLKKPRK